MMRIANVSKQEMAITINSDCKPIFQLVSPLVVGCTASKGFLDHSLQIAVFI